MSFCCGASMIGTVGTVKHMNTYIHEVPILFCPICNAHEIYSKVKEDYDIIADYAYTDHAPEIFFSDYVEIEELESFFTDCVEVNSKITTFVLRSQIDHALDLLMIAKQLKEEAWQQDLYHRLKVLSSRYRKYTKKEAEQNS
jgi:hypothetical protein